MKERVRQTYRQMHLNQTVDFVQGKLFIRTLKFNSSTLFKHILCKAHENDMEQVEIQRFKQNQDIFKQLKIENRAQGQD